MQLEIKSVKVLVKFYAYRKLRGKLSTISISRDFVLNLWISLLSSHRLEPLEVSSLFGIVVSLMAPLYK